jgi:hypothetical protein
MLGHQKRMRTFSYHKRNYTHMNDRIPHVELRLVDYIDKLFPDRCPNEADSERGIWLAAGAVRVVKKLRQIAESQAGTIESVLDSDSDD